jgi:flagellar secretion chaperone FliS
MRGIAAYKENAVATQSRGRLVVLLYEGAIRFLRQAQQELEAGDMAAKGEHINKAVAILHELDSCLNMDDGGEIAQNLRSIYQFMVRHLGEANVQRNPTHIQDVIECLESLNESWKAITV